MLGWEGNRRQTFQETNKINKIIVFCSDAIFHNSPLILNNYLENVKSGSENNMSNPNGILGLAIIILVCLQGSLFHLHEYIIRHNFISGDDMYVIKTEVRYVLQFILLSAVIFRTGCVEHGKPV